MLNQALIIARKEIVDGLRDGRAMLSSLLYSCMGPGVVLMVSFAIQGKKGGLALIGMSTVFILLSVFLGGMSLAMDTLAGERERRSLLPLLMNPLTPLDLILGKWLAVSLFASGGLAVNLASFGFIAARSGAGINPLDLVIFGACLLVPLALLAAALELAVSTLCRSVKEAHTYLSALVFAPMLLAMFLVFFPRVAGLWSVFTPLIGHQLMLDLLMRGGGAPLIPLLALGLVTAAATAAALRTAAEQLEREDVLYGV